MSKIDDANPKAFERRGALSLVESNDLLSAAVEAGKWINGVLMANLCECEDGCCCGMRQGERALARLESALERCLPADNVKERDEPDRLS